MTEPRSSSNGDGNGLPEASLGESVRFVVAGLLPAVVRGLFCRAARR